MELQIRQNNTSQILLQLSAVVMLLSFGASGATFVIRLSVSNLIQVLRNAE